MNRWCAFILALGLGLFALASSGDPANATQTMNWDSKNGGDLSPSGEPSPTAGDPDIPENGTRSRVVRGAASPLGAISDHAEGDGVTVRSEWMWRIQVVLQLLRHQAFVRF
jgi:hypothetical protein